MGATYGFFQTRLAHPDGISLREDVTSVAFGRRLGEYTLHGNVGAVLGGSLETLGRTFDIGPGWLGNVSLARRWLLGEDRSWFVTGSLTVGASSAPTREAGIRGEDITALDLRLGVIGGVTLWQLVSPYLLARAFSGPVLWARDGEEIRVGDLYHYNLGAGMSLRLPWNVIALVDVSALGERSLSLGMSVLF